MNISIQYDVKGFPIPDSVSAVLKGMVSSTVTLRLSQLTREQLDELCEEFRVKVQQSCGYPTNMESLQVPQPAPWARPQPPLSSAWQKVLDAPPPPYADGKPTAEAVQLHRQQFEAAYKTCADMSNTSVCASVCFGSPRKHHAWLGWCLAKGLV